MGVPAPALTPRSPEKSTSNQILCALPPSSPTLIFRSPPRFRGGSASAPPHPQPLPVLLPTPLPSPAGSTPKNSPHHLCCSQHLKTKVAQLRSSLHQLQIHFPLCSCHHLSHPSHHRTATGVHSSSPGSPSAAVHIRSPKPEQPKNTRREKSSCPSIKSISVTPSSGLCQVFMLLSPHFLQFLCTASIINQSGLSVPLVSYPSHSSHRSIQQTLLQ